MSGQNLIPDQRAISKPVFVLPARISCEITNRSCAARQRFTTPPRETSGGLAAQERESDTRPGQAHSRRAKVIVPHKNGTDIFLAIGLTFDQLQNRATGYRYLSTWDLVRRIQYPTAHASSTRLRSCICTAASPARLSR